MKKNYLFIILSVITFTHNISYAYDCQKVEWDNPINVTIDDSDGSIRSTTNTSYGSGGHSKQKIAIGKNGAFEFTAFDMTGFIGLSSNPASTTGIEQYVNINYAIQLWSSNGVLIVESGIERGLQTSWSPGDVFKIEKIGTQITYSKNGTIFYTSTVEAKSDLYARFSYGGIDKGFNAPVMCVEPDCNQVEWTSQMGVTVGTDGSIRSTTNISYGSNAYSVDKIPASENGSFEFTAYSMTGFVGLSDDPSATGYTSIDYAIQLWTDNEVWITESGAPRGVKTSWATGDIFKIVKEGTQIIYYKNDSSFYSSEVESNSDLHADFSFGNEGTGFDAPKLCISGDVLAISSETPLLTNLYKLYPNPSSGVFYFSSPFTGKIDVFSTSGQLIKTLESTLTNNIDLSELSNGIYFVRKLSEEGTSEVQQIIVEK